MVLLNEKRSCWTHLDKDKYVFEQSRENISTVFHAWKNVTNFLLIYQDWNIPYLSQGFCIRGSGIETCRNFQVNLED